MENKKNVTCPHEKTINANKKIFLVHRKKNHLQGIQIWRSIFCLHRQMTASPKKKWSIVWENPSPLFDLQDELDLW